MITRKVFICSPYRGDVKKNVELAREHCRCAVKEGYIPVAPHLYFPQFLDDCDTNDRENGISMGIELLKLCDEVWVYANGRDGITSGMAMEVEIAISIGKPIRFMMQGNPTE